MDGKKPTSGFWTIFSAACGLVSVIGWLGITPERVGQLAYDVLYPVLPFAAFGFGCLTGFFLRDHMKERDAEIEARIEMEKAEHAAKLEREREEHEMEKAAEAERNEYDKKLRAAAVEFKNYDVYAKTLACLVYDNGEFVADIDMNTGSDDFSIQVRQLTERETLPKGKFRYTLKPRVCEMFDKHPELLVDVRNYTARMRAAADKEATRENPEVMLQYMSADELKTLKSIIENDGRLDLSMHYRDAHYDTLHDFGMLSEYIDDLMYPPVYDLDEAVLEFFKKECNKDLVDSYLANGPGLGVFEVRNDELDGKTLGDDVH